MRIPRNLPDTPLAKTFIEAIEQYNAAGEAFAAADYASHGHSYGKTIADAQAAATKLEEAEAHLMEISDQMRAADAAAKEEEEKAPAAQETAQVKDEVADEIATALIHTAQAGVAMAQAEVAEDAGDEDTAEAHEEAAQEHHAAATNARHRAEQIIEQAQARGVHVGDAARVSAETIARARQSPSGKSVGALIAELEGEARTIRRSK